MHNEHFIKSELGKYGKNPRLVGFKNFPMFVCFLYPKKYANTFYSGFSFCCCSNNDNRLLLAALFMDTDNYSPINNKRNSRYGSNKTDHPEKLPIGWHGPLLDGNPSPKDLSVFRGIRYGWNTL